MKIYPKFKLNDAMKRKSVQREIICMKKIQHPNVLKLLDSFETEKEVILILEYISGGSLYQSIKSKGTKKVLPEDLAMHYFKQICEGGRYLHG